MGWEGCGMGWCGMGDLRLVWPIRNGDGVWQFQLRKDGIKHEYRASNTPGTYPEAKTLRDMWEEEAEPAVPGTEKTFLHSATISKLLPLDSRGTAHQHNTTRREEEITEEFLVARPENVWSCGLYTKLFWARRPESSDTLKILSE